MESAQQYTKRMLRKYALKTKKSLGQNFLIDDQIIEQIISVSDPEPTDAVLEVGPGIGILTRELVNRVQNVTAIELDQSLCNALTQEFKETAALTVINADALKFSLQEMGLEEGRRLKLIANLPYYITSPLLNHFLEQRQFLQSMTIMVQEEVAKRLVARPANKDYGILTLAVQAFCTAEILFVVPGDAFIPAPKVNSAVVRLEILAESKLGSLAEADFFRVVKAAFGQRRKTLLNSLSQGLNLNREELGATLAKLGLSPSLRAENLSLEDFCRLAEELSNE